LRRIATEYGVFPTSVRPVRTISASLIGEGNPLNEKRENRAAWAEGLSVKAFTEGMEVLYFSGCYLSYDPRLKKVASATANILNKAGIDAAVAKAFARRVMRNYSNAWPEKTSKLLSKMGSRKFLFLPLIATTLSKMSTPNLW
jgi:hypothetical protein